MRSFEFLLLSLLFFCSVSGAQSSSRTAKDEFGCAGWEEPDEPGGTSKQGRYVTMNAWVDVFAKLLGIPPIGKPKNYLNPFVVDHGGSSWPQFGVVGYNKAYLCIGFKPPAPFLPIPGGSGGGLDGAAGGLLVRAEEKLHLLQPPLKVHGKDDNGSFWAAKIHCILNLMDCADKHLNEASAKLDALDILATAVSQGLIVKMGAQKASAVAGRDPKTFEPNDKPRAHLDKACEYLSEAWGWIAVMNQSMGDPPPDAPSGFDSESINTEAGEQADLLNALLARHTEVINKFN